MEVIGDYEYNSANRLGLGAFAIVFKGRSRKKPDMDVAVKTIMKKNIPKTQSLLKKEIDILRKLTVLQHDNVVHLLECLDTDDAFHLVMEYCNGGDLQDYLNVKGCLSEDTIQIFLRQLAGAMYEFNKQGILHRDLKPQNILLKFSGETRYPEPNQITLKIADFGFARCLDEGVMAATMCGSPMYMAPEVIMSLQYDAKADLWSLGTIIFQCLAGKAPFFANSPAGLKQIYEKTSNLMPKIPPGTSSDLSNLLFGLLKRNPKDRISFETFFDHTFLKMKPPPVTMPSPLANSPKTPSVFDQGYQYSVSPDLSDEYVIVPSNIPAYHQDKDISASPPRPSTLSIQTQQDYNNPRSPLKAVPRSQPITMNPRTSKNISGPDFCSISPPSVQFMLGTPPSGRRISETPPYNTWNFTPTSSPLKKSVLSSPILNTQQFTFNPNQKIGTVGLPFSNNNRAMTLPELGNITFPELPQETILEKEHIETLAKLNFVLALVECIVECASPKRPRYERLVLLIRALQLLSSSLSIATSELKAGRLQPSTNVKNVVQQLNETFHKVLDDCKQINVPNMLHNTSSSTTTAEKLLYDYAVEICAKAALKELGNTPYDYFKSYQTAQILLHSLSQQVNSPSDKEILIRYRDAVEKRLSILQDQGYVYSNTVNGNNST